MQKKPGNTLMEGYVYALHKGGATPSGTSRDARDTSTYLLQRGSCVDVQVSVVCRWGFFQFSKAQPRGSCVATCQLSCTVVTDKGFAQQGSGLNCLAR